MRLAATLLLLLAACQGATGTVAVSLVTAPGSTVLEAAQTMKLVVTQPHQVKTASRASDGAFDLALSLKASSAVGTLIVDAYDASGNLIATGTSPPFPFGAIDASVSIYMAPPLSIAAAPVALEAARGALGAGTLSYGAIFAGGFLGGTGTGSTSDAVAIYNTYTHTIATGMALPAPRAGLAVGVGANGIVYLFGGNDDTGAAVDNLWRFDTNIAPAGQYTDFGDKTGFARTGQIALPIGNDRFLVSGNPAALLAGLEGTVTASDVATLPAAGATVTASDGVATTIFASAAGVVRYRAGAFDMLSIADAARDNATLAALPGGRVIVACGGGTDAVVIDAASGAATTYPNVPATARSAGCAIAATSRHVVIAGGSSAGGTIAPSVEIFDVNTLAPVATAPLVVGRTAASAIALPNDQVLIAGGTLAASPATTNVLELFTPDPTE